MDRITNAHLETLVTHINKITNNPVEACTNNEGKFTWNVGSYCIGYSFNGVNLERISSNGGGVSQPFGHAAYTKRELYEKMQAFIRGIEAAK